MPEDKAPEIVVEMRGITKRFPGVLANDKVDFDLRRSEIHALLGENGAGKSTLMSVLAGLYHPETGSIVVNGKPVSFSSPRAAIQAGIGGKRRTAKPEHQAAVEIEAPGTPPLANQIWVPGCWYWSGGRYIGRRGYWITPHAGWVWVPSHYVWTPRGYIFSPGHWDYDLDSRDVLFAPAYFPAEVRVRVGFVFCPAVCVDLGILRLNLFAYPRYNHYCFGDYYDDAYLRVGIYPWFQCQTVHTWYDPLFVYDRWHFRQTDPHWARTQGREYQVRRLMQSMGQGVRADDAELDAMAQYFYLVIHPTHKLNIAVRKVTGQVASPIQTPPLIAG